jgi:hypothetical protein
MHMAVEGRPLQSREGSVNDLVITPPVQVHASHVVNWARRRPTLNRILPECTKFFLKSFRNALNGVCWTRPQPVQNLFRNEGNGALPIYIVHGR